MTRRPVSYGRGAAHTLFTLRDVLSAPAGSPSDAPQTASIPVGEPAGLGAGSPLSKETNMCGIVAILGASGEIEREPLDKATRTLHHRGPDAHQIWVSPLFAEGYLMAPDLIRE
jgi:hypothetical protein